MRYTEGNVPIEHVPLTKAALNKILVWTPSRYNSYKKGDVVNQIFQGMKDGGYWELHWKKDILNGGYPRDYYTKVRDVESPPDWPDRVEILVPRKLYSAGSYSGAAFKMGGGDYWVDFPEKRIYVGFYSTGVFDPKKVERIIQF